MSVSLFSHDQKAYDSLLRMLKTDSRACTIREGIHVYDTSGVIWFRPTGSPIIYKHQVSRALSLILGIVANIYNLYTVDALQNEIAEVIQLYQERGNSDQILVEDFTAFLMRRQVVRRSGGRARFLLGCDVSSARSIQGGVWSRQCAAHYKTSDRLSPGNWCACQRKVYAGKTRGIHTE